MHVFLVTLVVLAMAEPDTELPRLEVKAVRARHKLTVRAITREPALDVILLGCGVVQLARNHENNTEWKTKCAKELASVVDHLVVDLVAFTTMWACDAELFDLLELVDTEDTPVILARSTSLLSEAG